MTDTFTSILGGSAIFAVLGNLAHNTGHDIKDLIKNKMAVSFISYPEAIAKIAASISNKWYFAQVSLRFLLYNFKVINFLVRVTMNFSSKSGTCPNFFHDKAKFQKFLKNLD